MQDLRIRAAGARTVALLVSLALLLAACGGGGGDAPPDDGGADAAADVPTDDAPEDDVPEDDAAADEAAATDDAAAGDDATDEAGADDADADDADADDADADDAGGDGGTVVFGADQEPAILNPAIQEGILYANSVVLAPVLAPLWRLSPDLTYEPLLLADEPVVEEDPFRVTYTLLEEAVWSDGTPITADDVVFTWETRVDPDVEVISRAGYDQITEAEVVDDKTVTFTFDDTYAAWRTLFSTIDGAILPAHLLEGEDVNQVWRDELPIASGPFVIDSWNQGRDLTLVRNDAYWGEPAALDRIVFRFIEESTTQVQQLRGGEIDVLAPQAQVDLLAQLEDLSGVTVDVANGAQWEHLNLNTEFPALAPLYVRQALAMGIDRTALVDALIAPLNPDAEPLDSIIYVSNAPEYEPNWADQLAYDPDGAVALLEENGCERGDDGIFVCEGERLAFPYATTTGNERRELTFEVLQAQLEPLGIALEADFSEAAVLFGTRLTDRDFGISAWAWTGSSDPFNAPSQWGCDDGSTGGQNFSGICNQEATDLMVQANRTVDPDERAALFNEADALLAEDLIAIPLYQSPTITAASEAVSGVVTNPSNWGPTWNAGEWTIAP